MTIMLNEENRQLFSGHIRAEILRQHLLESKINCDMQPASGFKHSN